MTNLKIAVVAALAAAGVGLGSLMTIPQAVNQADCPYGWYWDDERQNCLPLACLRIHPMDALPATARISTAQFASISTNSGRRRSRDALNRLIPPGDRPASRTASVLQAAKFDASIVPVPKVYSGGLCRRVGGQLRGTTAFG